MANSKILLSTGEVLLDLTNDTVAPSNLLKGFTAHGPDGEPVTGACEFDADTSDATASAAEILKGKTAYKNGQKLTGSMPNNGAVNGTISTKDGTYTVPQGFHDGSGKVAIDAAEKSKLIPENIREGITVLGVVGEMSGTEDAKPQAKTVQPTFEEQEILPDTGYNYLSSVKVGAIRVTRAENNAGGITVTIG